MGNKLYCHKCRQEARDQDIFCSHCGTKLQNKTSDKTLWVEKLCLWGDENKISELCSPQTEESLLNITSLDISEKKLTEIPDEICKLENLTELNLNYNYLTELPKDIGNLSQLHSLGISCQFLHDLPESIVKINKLKELYHLESKLSGGWHLIGKYRNWIYGLLKDGCNIILSMEIGQPGDGMGMIDVKYSIDTWKNTPYTMRSAEYEITCRYDDRSDKFLYFSEGIEVFYLPETEEWFRSRDGAPINNYIP